MAKGQLEPKALVIWFLYQLGSLNNVIKRLIHTLYGDKETVMFVKGCEKAVVGSTCISTSSFRAPLAD